MKISRGFYSLGFLFSSCSSKCTGSCTDGCGGNCGFNCSGGCGSGCSGGCGSGLNFTLKEIVCSIQFFQDPHFFIFIYLGHHNDYFSYLNNYVKGS